MVTFRGFARDFITSISSEKSVIFGFSETWNNEIEERITMKSWKIQRERLMMGVYSRRRRGKGSRQRLLEGHNQRGWHKLCQLWYVSFHRKCNSRIRASIPRGFGGWKIAEGEKSIHHGKRGIDEARNTPRFSVARALLK
jgi:hypothetical protein